MNRTLKYILIFGIVTILMVAFVVSSISYIEPPQKQPSEIRSFSYDNDSVRCFYIDTDGVKSYLTCVQVESQTVLK